MSTKVIIKESELISLVKRIVENIEYDELDYANAFFQIFMDWIRKNTPEKFWSYPVGFLVQKYSYPFIKDVIGDDFYSRTGVNKDYVIGRYDIERIVKSAIRKGHYTLPSLYSEEKFIDKYKKIIPTVIENLELPETFAVPTTANVASGDPVLTPKRPAVLIKIVLLLKLAFEVTVSVPPLIVVTAESNTTFEDVRLKWVTAPPTFAPENTTFEVMLKFAATATVPPRKLSPAAITLAENIPTTLPLPDVVPPALLAAVVTTTVDTLSKT